VPMTYETDFRLSLPADTHRSRSEFLVLFRRHLGELAASGEDMTALARRVGVSRATLYRCFWDYQRSLSQVDRLLR
jgi:DNA-binding phage protein